MPTTRRATACTCGSATRSSTSSSAPRWARGRDPTRTDGAPLASRPPMDDAAPDDANLTHWEALARFHGTGDDSYYDLDLLRAGGALMGDEERAAIGAATGGRGLAGMAVLHLQCHIGCDSVAMAREGATVTAVDFSRTALDRLEVLAEECGAIVATL